MTSSGSNLPPLYPSIRSAAPYAGTMQNNTPPDNGSMEMSLRDAILAAGAGQQPPPQAPMQHLHGGNPQHGIDPAIGGQQQYGIVPAVDGRPPGSPGSDNNMPHQRGRRELSNSKRAAQNRAAQRAFRQRKELYIKELEEKVKELDELREHFNRVTVEGYQLRDYIILLQGRLLNLEQDVPPAPEGIDLHRNHAQHTNILSQHGVGHVPQVAEQQQQQQQQQQQAQQPQQHQTHDNNGGLSEHQIGELQMAAQAAAVQAAQQGVPSADAAGHQGQVSAFDAARRGEESTAPGQPSSPRYPHPQYEPAQNAHN